MFQVVNVSEAISADAGAHAQHGAHVGFAWAAKSQQH